MKIGSADELRKESAIIGGTLGDSQIEQVFKLKKLVEDWNAIHNLTRVKPEDFFARHILDSFALTKAVDLSGISDCIDVGTGAGFPGLPLAIAFPKIKFVLLDSVEKKIRFVRNAVEELGLKNVEVVRGRAEEISKEQKYRHKFPLVVARAVAPLDKLAGWLIPFAKRGGLVVAYKGEKAREELKTAAKLIKTLGGRSIETVEYSIGEDGGQGVLVKIGI